MSDKQKKESLAGIDFHELEVRCLAINSFDITIYENRHKRKGIETFMEMYGVQKKGCKMKVSVQIKNGIETLLKMMKL